MQYTLFELVDSASPSQLITQPEPVNTETGLVDSGQDTGVREWPTHEAWLQLPLSNLLDLWYDETAQLMAPSQIMIDTWTTALHATTGRDKAGHDRRRRCKTQIRLHWEAQQRTLRTFQNYYVGGMEYVEHQLREKLHARYSDVAIDPDWVSDQLSALFHQPDPTELHRPMNDLLTALTDHALADE